MSSPHLVFVEANGDVKVGNFFFLLKILLLIFVVSLIFASVLLHLHRSWCCFQTVSISAIILRSHFRSKRMDAFVNCHCVEFFLHRLVVMVKDKRNKKKRQTSMIQQQSASRVQLPSLFAAKELKHGKRRQLSAPRTKQMKTRAYPESDQSSGQDADQSGEGDLSDGEGSASSPTDDGSSGEVIAMSQRTVHEKKRSKLKRINNGFKTFPTSCSTVASGRGSFKRVQHLKTLKAINKARLPLCIVHRAFELPRCQVVVRRHRGESQDEIGRLSHGGHERIPLDDAQLLPFARGKGLIQPIERMLSENEKFIWELAESFSWRNQWLQDEELSQKQ